MNIFIYALLLSIWTTNCLNTNQTNGSSTTGAKQLELREPKLDDFRRHLLIFLVGIMIIAFTFTWFCFLHYNCMSDDTPKAETVTNESTAAMSSWPSKISVSDSNITNLYCVEKHSMLSSMEKLSGPSSPEKLSIPSSAEKLIRTPSPEKPYIPNNKEKLTRTLSPGKSSILSSMAKLIRKSRSKKSKPSSLKRLRRSSRLKKLYRRHSLEKLIHAHKLVNQVISSYPDKPVLPPWPASIQSSAGLAESPHLPHSQSQIVSSKPSSLKKLAKSHRYPNLKRSANMYKTVMLSKPLLAKSCQCYKERCLGCNISSELLINNTSEAKKKNAGNLHVSSTMKSSCRSFHKVNSKDNIYSDMMTYDSDDSDTEIVIFCNISRNDIIPKSTSNN